MEISNFIFNGVSLADIDMIPGSINTDSQSMTPATLNFTVTTTPTSKTKRFVSSHYDDTISFEIGIVKDPCASHDPKIDIETDRFIRRWLIREDGFKIMRFECEDYEDILVNCYLNVAPIYLYGALIGYTITGSTDSPYVSVVDYVKEFSLTGEGTVEIPATSDEIGFLYPKIEITPKSTGELIFGFSDNAKINTVANVTYVLDCDKSIITGLSDPNKFNWIFPRMQQDWNHTNQLFYCNKACDVKITYTPRRRVIL